MFQCRWGPLLRRPGLGALTGRPQRAPDQGSQTPEGEVCGQAGEKGVGPSHPLRERNRDDVVELGGDTRQTEHSVFPTSFEMRGVRP